ncbi:hypothetical protein JYJ95_29775 [Corallococcus exiguus]|uniref:hypothetical protein n=1 Tax=Corallococcus exiguus TaxID=83462 RepID=UPI001A8ED82C|nr:hypothetical protein [Corallococcus exiguus]MBN8470715.1 hypothetical protein [Corallococcus exiguus]
MGAKTARDISGYEFDWLACDGAGHVGFFSTAGGGYAPEAFLRDTDAHSDAIEALLALPGPMKREPETQTFSPFHHTWQLMAERGVFAYDADPNGGPYQLKSAPANPIRVEDLPDSIATVARQNTLKGLDFSGLKVITGELIKTGSQKQDTPMDYDTVIDSLRPAVQRGLSREDAVVALHDAGLTIIYGIKGISQLYGLSIGDAKSVVAGHPVWRGIVKAAEPLHQELEDYAEKMKGGGNPDDL